MRILCVRSVWALAILLSGATLRALSAEQTLRGEVQGQGQSELLLESYTAELDDLRSHLRVMSTDVRVDGTFEFANYAPCDCSINIMDSRGEVVAQRLLTTGSELSTVSIRLPKHQPVRPPSGPVSVNQLRHPPAKKAWDSMLAAQKLSQAGRTEEAAAELEKAIRISPEYPDAYNNLAAQYLRLERYEPALKVLEQAAQLGGPDAMVLSNMAFAQFKLGRYQDAMISARASLQTGADLASAHYVLGSLLAAHQDTLREAAVHLERAAQTMPGARLNLEKVQRILDSAASH